MNKTVVMASTIGAVVTIAFLSLVYISTNKSTSAPATVFTEVSKSIPGDHVKWTANSKNVLIEYSDLQCPACKAYHDYMHLNLDNDKAITGKIKFVYRHFPLSQHIHSQEAAQAAEAAGKQDKFFEYADLLFDTQTSWESLPSATQYFLDRAKELKLNLDQFKKDMNSAETKKVIQDDMTSGGQATVDATPTFYLNGTKLVIASFDDFKTQLQALK